ncbi:T9SS type A sorting domain-containing protein [Bacteroidota bacterium]
MSQNYPNPFNPTTTIYYSISNTSTSNVTLQVYNLLGEMVTEIINEVKAQGNYSVEFNAGQLPTGLYLYKIQASDFSSVKKMMLVK